MHSFTYNLRVCLRMAVYSQDVYQDTTKVKYIVVLTVPLNILTCSTSGFLS